MGLVVHNTRSRTKEPFEPLVPGRVSMYVCGPTVYDVPHLGHARASVAFDVIRRSLEFLGYRVTYVQNITDVDDKIINKAAEEGATPWEIAERYTREYEDEMRRIRVLPPTITPKATGHIPDMIDLISRLIDAGAAYAVDGGDVYFAVDKFTGYGSLSNRSLDDMRAGERVEVDPRKRHPMDFALWKGAKEWQVHWPSPWGPGRPGWHIECSAMSMKYLGETFDIHGGGQDLIFPHHENEAAQSEAVTHAPLARYWLHNGFVTVNQEKMSKSLKNFTSLGDVLAASPAPAVRTLLASVHYRSPLEMSGESVEEATAVWERLATFHRNASEALGLGPPRSPQAWERLAAALSDGMMPPSRGPETPVATDEEHLARFRASIEDDFNTPEAFAAIHEVISEANPLVDKAAPTAAELERLEALYGSFSAMTFVLGLDPGTDWRATGREMQVGGMVEYLLEMRAEARSAKDYARADQIRAVLSRSGVVVEDRPGGARWYLANPWT